MSDEVKKSKKLILVQANLKPFGTDEEKRKKYVDDVTATIREALQKDEPSVLVFDPNDINIRVLEI